MAIRIHLQQNHRKALATFRDQQAALSQIEDLLAKLEKQTVDGLHGVLTDAVEDSEVAGTLSGLFLSLSTLARRAGMSPDEVVSQITDALNSSPNDWSEDQLKLWQDELGPQLARVLKINTVQTIAKSIDLAYDYTWLFDTARVLTDLRPIFSDGDELGIESLIVTQTLRLEYTGPDGEHSLSLTLDQSDLESLKEQCERALAKAKAAAKALRAGLAPLEPIIHGESLE